MAKSLMPRSFVILWQCSWASVVRHHSRPTREGVSFSVHVSLLALSTFRAPLLWLSRAYFVTFFLGMALLLFSIIDKLLYCIDQLLWRKAGTVLLSFISVNVSRLTKVAIGPIDEMQVSNFLIDNSASALESKNFTMCACNVYLIMSLRSRSNITCYKLSETTDRISLCQLWNDILREFSSNSSTIVSISFVTIPFTTYLTSRVEMSLSLLQLFLCDDFQIRLVLRQGRKAPLWRLKAHISCLLQLLSPISVRLRVSVFGSSSVEPCLSTSV